MIFPDFLQNFDEQLFFLINQKWGNNFFDTILPPIRDRIFWVPLYLLIAILILWKFKKKGILLILLLGLNFGISDQLSSAVIKPAVNRTRPCNDENLKDSVILRIDRCGVGKSFTSSHATNTFAFAVLCILFFRKRIKWLTPIALIWALSISYAQVYVGVHYPLDILAGGLLGTIISLIIYTLAKKFLFPKWVPELLTHTNSNE
jgi:membrane-associated phospholipid phosphatase